MSDEPTRRRPGRPRQDRPPRREIHIKVAEDVLTAIGDANYSAFFEAAAREKLARAAVERTAGRPAKTTKE